MGIINFLLFSLISLKNPSFDGSSCLVFSSSLRCYFTFRLLKNSCTCWAPIVVFPSSSVVSHASFLLLVGSTIFFIVGGFGGCTGLEDCAPTVFSVVLLWLGGFFAVISSAVVSRFFSDMLWWLGSFSDVLSWLGGFFRGAVVFFCAFYGACFAAIGFFCCFGGDLGLMSISWLELAPPELNNGSCVDGERGDIEGREDDLGDDDGRDYGDL
jgi:hypothetical protein